MRLARSRVSHACDCRCIHSYSPLSDNYATCSNPAVIVDTSLLKAYIKAKESLAIYFIRGKNYCHVKECEKELLARGVRAAVARSGCRRPRE